MPLRSNWLLSKINLARWLLLWRSLRVPHVTLSTLLYPTLPYLPFPEFIRFYKLLLKRWIHYSRSYIIKIYSNRQSKPYPFCLICITKSIYKYLEMLYNLICRWPTSVLRFGENRCPKKRSDYTKWYKHKYIIVITHNI